jgi:hypothetical protein
MPVRAPGGRLAEEEIAKWLQIADDVEELYPIVSEELDRGREFLRSRNDYGALLVYGALQRGEDLARATESASPPPEPEW